MSSQALGRVPALGTRPGLFASLRGLCAAVVAGALMLLAGAAATPASAQTATCGLQTYTLYAGQYTDSGTVTIWQDENQIHVKVDSTVAIDDLHLWVGTDLNNLPKTTNGTPIPGQFPFQATPGPGTYTYQFDIDWADAGITDVTTLCGTPLYIVLHAALHNGETAFAGNVSVNVGSSGRWWYYISTVICVGCGDVPPPPPPAGTCQTAFAKSVKDQDGWIFASAPRANPEGYPSLNLIRNRWGWVINLGAPNALGVNNASNTYIYDIWAGAGLNRTANGTKVGTLSVTWDAGSKTASNITYNLSGGWTMSELHVYASDLPPTKTAPGQYGFTHYFDPPTTGTYSVPVTVTDTDGDGVWIIAHAVVCPPAQ